MFMPNITIGRYDSEHNYSIGQDGERKPFGWSGWIEDDKATWILFLDEDGHPALFWPERDELGGVLGAPIELVA